MPATFTAPDTMEASVFESLIPIVTAIFTIQTVFAIPSVVLETDIFYDLCGIITLLEVTGMSLYYPYISGYYVSYQGLSDDDDGTKASSASHLSWRQTVLSLAVVVWTFRRR